jgi:hypothetical protein
MRYRTSPAQVAQWNHVAANASFRPGSSITVMVPNKAHHTVVVSAPGHGKAAIAPRGSHKTAAKAAAPRARVATRTPPLARKRG